MTLNKKTFYALFLISILHGSVRGNDTNPSPTDSSFIRLSELVRGVYHFSRIYPQEKVWLHFDNAGYFQGDTIWFKAYVRSTHPERHVPLSRVLYVELVSPIGQVIHTRKLKIENGECHGELPLRQSTDLNEDIKRDSTLSLKKVNDVLSGFYEVRAYTRYMLNWDTEGIFSRVLPVYDRPQFADAYHPGMLKGIDPLPERREEAEKLDKVNVSFYPEGGHMVENVSCRIAYLITDHEGIPLSIPATLHIGEDVKKDIPCLHEGMGMFTYTPTEQKATLTLLHNSKKYSFTLPKVEREGYSMAIDLQPNDSLCIKVSPSAQMQSRLLGITIQHKGQVYRFDTLTVNQASTQLKISTNPIPCGVCQITLFDEWGHVWASRLLFIRHQDNLPLLKLTLDTDTLHQQADSITNLRIKALRHDDTPFQGNLSVSVRDERYEFAPRHSESITINQLIGSELKGYIHNPYYYFEQDDEVHRQALDLLMMVQGWRRYDWQTMSRPQAFDCPYYIEDGLILSGKVLANWRDKPQIGRNVHLWMYDDYHNVTNKGNCLTDSAGGYNFRFPDFYGRTEMHLTLKDRKKTKNVRFMIDREISPQPRTYRQDEISLAYLQTNLGKKRGINEIQELPDVVKSARRSIKKEGIHMVLDVDQEANRLLDKGIHVMEVGDFLEKMDIGISHQMTEMSVSSTYFLFGKEANFWVKNGRASVNVPRTQIVYWEELDIDNVKRIRLYDVKYLSDHPEVHDAIRDPRSRYSIKGYSSLKLLKDERIGYDLECMFTKKCVWSEAMILIDVKSKREQNADIKGLRSTYFDGYYSPKTFMADYTHRQPTPGKDFRRTLYWNPEVKTDEKGEATVIFRNNSTDNAWKATVAGQDLKNNTCGWNTIVVEKGKTHSTANTQLHSVKSLPSICLVNAIGMERGLNQMRN